MSSREEFEAWAKSRHFHNLGFNGTHLMWESWQASRAAALEEAAKECDLMQKHYLKDVAKYYPDATLEIKAEAAEECAMGIRALKGE